MGKDDGGYRKCSDVPQSVQHLINDIDVHVPQFIVACLYRDDFAADKVQNEAIDESNGCGKDSEASAG